MAETHIIARMYASAQELPAKAWNALLASQQQPTPFMQHEYLLALESSASAVPETGWTPCHMTLWDGDQLVAACPLYLKPHSWGEYVFDWAWANAYEQHGIPYYPKAVVAVPFTPVPGSRLLAVSDAARRQLVRALVQWCSEQGLSSLHILFAADADLQACEAEGLMQRHTVQFHWANHAPQAQGGHNADGYASFDAFLSSLNQEKRKKIRQERRRVTEAGVRFRTLRAQEIGPGDWDFFYRCYERTYLEHGNPPYLTRAFFDDMATHMAAHWLMSIATREGRDIACSLVALGPDGGAMPSVAYGRYWGALERVDCLHFEACYYQPLEWCIEHGVQRFEGGAQGEHKMARALMPVPTHSAHWLAHPAFADAVQRFLDREGQGIEQYLEHLGGRSPFRSSGDPSGR